MPIFSFEETADRSFFTSLFDFRISADCSLNCFYEVSGSRQNGSDCLETGFIRLLISMKWLIDELEILLRFASVVSVGIGQTTFCLLTEYL